MNFHKTIGYLAAFLLMVGLGVPDSFAQDTAGFRIQIAKPGNGKWADIGADKVEVHILRHRNIAGTWLRTGNITVTLRDTTDTMVNGSVVADPVLTEAAADAVTNQSAIDGYIADYEADPTTITESPENYGRASRVDTVKVLFEISAQTGTYKNKLAVYARATFGNFGSINSNDTQTSIFPDNAGLFPTKVGDGNLIKVDAQRPTASISIPEVTIDGDAAVTGTNDDVVVGSKIVIKSRVLNFRAQTVEISLEKTANSSLIYRETTISDDNLESRILFSKSFNAREILLATEPLSASLTVKANQFKLQAKADIKDDDDVILIKKDAFFEVDVLSLVANVVAKDEAGNANAGVLSQITLTTDTKPPVITFVYPDSAHHRFTEKREQSFNLLSSPFTQTLKPLTIKVDEALRGVDEAADDTDTGNDSLFVIIGADTLKGSLTGDTGLGVITDGRAFDLTALVELAEPPVTFRWTNMHNTKNKKLPADDAGQGGSSVNIEVVVVDASGNKGSAKQTAIFDPKPPEILRLFPNNDALGDPGTVGGSEQTQHVSFRINESVDSISVRYVGLDRTHMLAGSGDQKTTLNKNLDFRFIGDNGLADNERYDLGVYARDLAGNVKTQEAINLTFDNDFNNPNGGAFKIVSQVRKSIEAKPPAEDPDLGFADGNIALAGQAIRLTITALDTMLTRTSGEDKPAVIYKKAGVKLVAMDSDGNMISSVKFWGTGVTNNGDGSASLDSDGWDIGVRNVFLSSNEMISSLSVAAKDMTESGVLNFMKTKAGLSVQAADFSKFVVTAWEEGVSQAVTSVWGQFTVNVIPADEFGNPSFKTFGMSEVATGKVDSLTLLDAKVKVKDDNILTDVDIVFSSDRQVGGPQGRQTIPAGGKSFSSFMIPAGSTGSATIGVQVDDSRLTDSADRSRKPRGSVTVTIQQPVEISITLWVDGVVGNQADNTVIIPAGGSVDVTARAEGLNEGDVVTFSTALGSVDVPANADGHAPYTVPLSGSGAVSVTATSGQYSAILNVVYEEAPAEEGRKAYVDSNGDPVYLIAKDSGTVGVDDFLALVAAFGSSEGDDNYNVQADVHPLEAPDGDVDVDDFLAFIGSFGKTAAVSGKPLVLLPGINENAEFSLSLGSDRVVAGELMAVDVSLANVEALIGYGFALNYDADKFEFVSVASADEDLLTSTGGETLFHHIAGDGQVGVATGMYNGTAVSGGGDIVRFVFRVLYEFEDNARFEIADGLVFDPSQLQNPAVVAGVLELQSTPKEFALHQNFPNPFNPDTTIKYDLSESADVTLQIYNVLGQVVRTLVASEAQNAGRYQIRWNGMDDRGVSVSSGIYFYRISAGEFQNVRKLMLLK